MTAEYIDIAMGILAFGLFMGAPFVPMLHRALDYCKKSITVSLWYILGILTLYYNTTVTQIFTFEDILVGVLYALFVIALMFIFSSVWQRTGRPLMPHTPYSEEATTFYDFTLRYTFVKGLEVFFQNVAAAAIIMGVYSLTGSVLETGLWFGGAFFALHAVSFWFFGKEWAFFITFASFVAGTVPVILILLVPGGVLYLFSFHILMYLLFLAFMRRRALLGVNLREGV